MHSTVDWICEVRRVVIAGPTWDLLLGRRAAMVGCAELCKQDSRGTRGSRNAAARVLQWSVTCAELCGLRVEAGRS